MFVSFTAVGFKNAEISKTSYDVGFECICARMRLKHRCLIHEYLSCSLVFVSGMNESMFLQTAIKGKLQELGAYVGKFSFLAVATPPISYLDLIAAIVLLLVAFFLISVCPPDEELPDYIMVMVANKKNAQQMAEDLSLFLGNNTLKFTVWLVFWFNRLFSYSLPLHCYCLLIYF